MILIDDMEYVVKLLFETYQIPVQYVSADQSIQILQPGCTINPAYPNNNALMMRIIEENDINEEPLLKMTDFMECYLVIHVGKQIRRGTIIVGPALISDMPEGILEGLFIDHQITSNIREEMRVYYNLLNLTNLEKWLRVAQLAAYLLFQKRIYKIELAEQPRLFVNLEHTVEKNLQSRRLEADFHLNYRIEQQIWQCVRDGDRERLTKVANSLQLEGFGVLSTKSHIRNLKNQAIISISLATRAAVEGGLYPEIAYTMSDAFILQVEDTHEIHRIYSLMMQYLYAFTDRVHANKDKSQSRIIAVCNNYIFDHIFERISVHTLARLVQLHPVYLSQLYKKETGLALNQYIQHEKIREAQKMLIQSDISVTEISALLHFNDHSYFSSIFKKITGITPNQYRKNPQPSMLN